MTTDLKVRTIFPPSIEPRRNRNRKQTKRRNTQRRDARDTNTLRERRPHRIVDSQISAPFADRLGRSVRIATTREHQDSIEHDVPHDECENKPECGCQSWGASKLTHRAAVSAQPSQQGQGPRLSGACLID